MEKITNNIGWKLLSVLLAFLLWVIVVDYEDPYTTLVLSDISVDRINAESIESEKKAIEYLDGDTVSIRVRGKRSVLDKLSSDDIYAYADLERMSITGAVDIEIESDAELTVLDVEPSMMMIELENIVTVQKEIQYYMEGEPSEGYIYLDPIITPNNIEIEGPESKVGLIRSVLVPVQIDGVVKDVTLYGTPQILDENNDAISGLTKSTTQVQIQVPIQKTETVNLVERLSDTVADGYELVNVSLSQDTLTLRGEESDLSSVTSIAISGIDLSQLTENTTLSINVSTILPSGVYVYNDVQTIEVYVEIEPVIQRTIEINPSDITVRQLPEDMSFQFLNEEGYSLSFSGVQSKVEGISVEDISPSITILSEEEGTQNIALTYYLPYGVELVGEAPTVEIELTTIVDTTDEDTGDEGTNNDQTTNN